MPPASANELIKVIPPGYDDDPDGRPPVYYVAVASFLGKLRWQTEVARAGGVEVSSAEWRQAYRDAANAALKGETLDRIVSGLDALEAGGLDEEEITEVVRLLNDFDAQAQQEWPPFAELKAREIWITGIRLWVATRLFLRRWEHVDGELVIEDGMVAEDSLAAIPDDHVQLIGRRAIDLMALTQKKRPDSGSPSP